jgi:hypothetical protein
MKNHEQTAKTLVELYDLLVTTPPFRKVRCGKENGLSGKTARHGILQVVGFTYCGKPRVVKATKSSCLYR